MTTARAGIASLISLAAVVVAATARADVEYRYTGADFTNFNGNSSSIFIGHHAIGKVVFANALPPSMSPVPVADSWGNLVSYSFSDGVDTFTNPAANPTSGIRQFGFTTNAAGQIVPSSFFLLSLSSATGDVLAQMSISGGLSAVTRETGVSATHPHGTSSDSAQSSTPGTWTGPFAVSPQPPVIKFDGTPVSQLAQPIPVVVGQLIKLTADPPNSSQAQPWSDPGNTVGGYLVAGQPAATCQGATCISGRTKATKFDDPKAVSYYWYEPGSYTITYSGNEGAANATFSVAGPTNANMIPKLGTIKIEDNKKLRCGLTLDDAVDCIKISPSSTIPVYDGTNVGLYQYVQLIDRSERFVDPTSLNANCIYKLGPIGSFRILDNNYPYILNAKKGVFTDNPGSGLPGAATDVDVYFSARVFLEWSPNLSSGDSLFVPLGVLDWSWKASAHQGGEGWTTPENGDMPTVDQPFKGVAEFPTWKGVALNSQCGVTTQ